MATSAVRRGTLSGVNLALLLTFAHLTNDAFANVLPVFLPTLQVRFGVGEAVLATFVAIISLSANVMQAFLGALADPPLTKDAIAGRIRRLLALADKRARELGVPDTDAAVTPEMLSC